MRTKIIRGLISGVILVLANFVFTHFLEDLGAPKWIAFGIVPIFFGFAAGKMSYLYIVKDDV